MNNIKNTACRSAWTYPIIDIGRGELRMCCKTPFNKISDSDWQYGTDIFKKLEAIKKLKRELLQGIRADKCRTCWTSEDFGIKSARTGFDDFAKFINAVHWTNITLEQTKERLLNLSEQDIEEIVNLEHIEHIELSLSTVCDLKCVYCSHVFSSQWATERLKYKEITINEVPKNTDDEYEKIWWQWFEQSAHKHVRKLTFVGGEPLINDKFYYYIDKLIDFYQKYPTNYQILVIVATNLNTPKKYMDRLIELINKIVVNNVKIRLVMGISFESIGKKNDFIRTNANWETFNENFLNLIDTCRNIDRYYDKTSIALMPALNTLSISSLPNYIQYVIDARKRYRAPLRLSNNHVTYPIRFSPFILTNDYVMYIDESIDLLKQSEFYTLLAEDEIGSWIKFVNYLETLKQAILNNHKNGDTIAARKEFVVDIDKLCERRNLDFASTFPEMIEFYNYCKSLT